MRSAGQDNDRYSSTCRACPRLARFLDGVRREHPNYHAKPVAPYGDSAPRLLIVGLAPGMHGANRTGRPFTGDYAGILLYATLHRFGFATAERSIGADDGLKLVGCRVTNAVKCLPPQNKPEGREVRTCNRYLVHEIADVPAGGAILALGTIAHAAILMALGRRPAPHRFAHAATHELGHRKVLFDSYHCSRYNTQTKRLTTEMFESVFEAIHQHLSHA